MKKWIWVIVAFICTFQMSGCLSEYSIPVSSTDGTYLYSDDARYAISISGEKCVISYGMNSFPGECSREADGTWKLTASDYSKIDLRAKLDGDQLLVSGDIILINARGQVDRASLRLENAIFEKRVPADLANIAGTSWQLASTNADIMVFMITPMNAYDLSFDTQGMTGSMGNSLIGTTPFTYTIENDELNLTFEDASKNGVGVIKNGELSVVYSDFTVIYRQIPVASN